MGCANAAELPTQFVKVTDSAMGENSSLPTGCSVVLHQPKNGQRTASVFLNTLRASRTPPCGGAASSTSTLWGGLERSQTRTIGAWIEVNSTTLRLTLTGPSNVWYG